MIITLQEDMEKVFNVRARRAACLGHLLMAAAHPVVICIGSIVAGIGWILSRARLRLVVGILLIIYGFLLSVMIIWLSSMGFSEVAEWLFNYNILSSEVAVFSSITFVIGVTAYGMLIVSFFELSKKYGRTLFRCAATALAFTIIMLFFTATILVIAVGSRGVFSISNIETLLTTFELSVISLIVINFIGNLLAGLGFLSKRS
ncbi:MAG: hypothetical protein ACXQTI_09385 [Candidatus Nezhaarchaeales archaeon]